MTGICAPRLVNVLERVRETFEERYQGIHGLFGADSVVLSDGVESLFLFLLCHIFGILLDLGNHCLEFGIETLPILVSVTLRIRLDLVDEQIQIAQLFFKRSYTQFRSDPLD